MSLSIRRLLVAALFLLTARIGGAQSCDSTLQRISFDTDTNNFRVIAMAPAGSQVGALKLRTGAAGELDFALLDETLQQLTPDIVVAADALLPARLAWNGVDFGLLYEDRQFHEIYQRIGADGQPVGGPVLLFGSAAQLEGKEYSQLLWNGRGWEFARTSFTTGGAEIRLTVFDVGGVVTYDRAMPVAADPPATPAIAVTPPPQANGAPGATTAVLWRGIGTDSVTRLYYLPVDTEKPFQVLVPSTSTGTDPLAVWDGGAFFVTVRKQGNKAELDSLRFDTNGTILRPPTFLVAGRGVEIVANSLAVTPTGLALEYIDAIDGASVSPGDVHVRRFMVDGTIESDLNVTTTFGLTTFRPTAAMIVSGSSTVSALAVQNGLNGGWDSLFVKLCPLTLTIQVPTFWPVGEVVQFSATPSGGIKPYAVSWETGDGGHLNGLTPSYRYGVSRTYTVTAQVTDSTGNIVSASKQIVIGTTSALTLTIASSPNPVAGHPVAFTASAGGGVAPLTVRWNFGDGSSVVTGSSVSHIYSRPGTYTVTTTVIDSTGASSSTSRTITVVAARRRAVNRS